MIFWALSALITAGTLVLILRPTLETRPKTGSSSDANIEIYRDQLAEIERDKERGILSDDEAASAELEVSRRLLTAADKVEAQNEAETDRMNDNSRMWVASIAAGTVTVLAMASYLALGSPGLPAQPHAERAGMDPRNLPVTELIARVESRLQTNPNDARGWDVIAPIYLRRKDYRKAAGAYQRAIELNGESPRRLAQYAEAILGATNGLVNDNVKSAYERLLKLRPDYYPAKFWLAVRHEQEGNRGKAAEAYSKLLGDTKLPGQMRPMIRQRLAEVSVGQAPAAKPDTTAPKTPESSNAGRAPELSKEARESMATLTPQQQQQRIRQMVDGLAERLRSDGGELGEWQRVIRSYIVLGDQAKAAEALKDARAALAAKPEEIKQLNAYAKSLPLN